MTKILLRFIEGKFMVNELETFRYKFILNQKEHKIFEINLTYLLKMMIESILML